MRVICTACLRRIHIAPNTAPAEGAQFRTICPECATPLLVDVAHNRTFAAGDAAYAEGGARTRDPELAELHAAVERMAVKVRAGMRGDLPGDDIGPGGYFDLDDND